MFASPRVVPQPTLALNEPIQTVRNALRTDRLLGLSHIPIRLAFRDGTLEVEGEVPSLAVKRRAIRLAAGHPAVAWVVDCLRVRPAASMSDATIRDHIVDAFLEEAAFRDCAIRRKTKGIIESVQEPLQGRGHVCVMVEEGAVTLDGNLPSRAHTRLAGVLAWWVPATRDVIDGLGVGSAEVDNDGEITGAVRMALEKDPLVDASQILVRTEGNVVTLTGLVWSPAERDIAENDAWFIFGVADVNNQLRVVSPT